MSFLSKMKFSLSSSGNGPREPWSVHHLNLLPPIFLSKSVPYSGPSPTPFPRYGHALPATASPAGELFLFGGLSRNSLRNDLYVILTRDLSASLLQTSGEIPSPRFGHAGAYISTVFFIWGGTTVIGDKSKLKGPHDDSLYLLNLESRVWTRVMVNGSRPVGRYCHAVTTVGSKLFVFGGKIDEKGLNDMWAFDLNSVMSNPVWESYEPAPGDKKPPPRGGHVLQTVGNSIILFGGAADDQHCYNDTWLFDVSTRKWTELPCTGIIPSPRQGHAAALVGDVMYVFGGYSVGGHRLGDLIAFKLSTQRWFMIQNMGSNPSGRFCHTMASEGTRVFVLGGSSLAGARGDDSALVHVLETKHIEGPNPDPNSFKPIEKSIQLAWNSSSSLSSLTQEQPEHSTSSPSDSHASHGTSPFQEAPPTVLSRPAFPYITRESGSSLNSLPRHVSEEDDGGGGLTEYRAKLAVPGGLSEGEVARSERERLVDLERQLSAVLAAQTRRDQRLTQLTDELALKSALLKEAEENVAEAMRRADLVVELERQLSATLLAQARRDQRLEQLTDELAQKSAQLEQAGAKAADAAKRTGLEHADRLLAQVEQKDTELVNMQAKLDALDELLLSRDQRLRALEQALQKPAPRAADADDSERSQHAHETKNRQYESELAGVRAELEAVRVRLSDAEDGWAKSKADADTLRAMMMTAGPVGTTVTDEDRIAHRLMERMRAMENEMASLRMSEKSLEMMDSRNEG